MQYLNNTSDQKRRQFNATQTFSSSKLGLKLKPKSKSKVNIDDKSEINDTVIMQEKSLPTNAALNLMIDTGNAKKESK